MKEKDERQKVAGLRVAKRNNQRTVAVSKRRTHTKTHTQAKPHPANPAHPANAVQTVSAGRIAVWESPEEPEESHPGIGITFDGDAIKHDGISRGRRSRLFPDLNITATAAMIGVTKSHLAKILGGKSKPSFDLAKIIAEVLGKDLAFVAALGHNNDVDATASRTRKKR